MPFYQYDPNEKNLVKSSIAPTKPIRMSPAAQSELPNFLLSCDEATILRTFIAIANELKQKHDTEGSLPGLLDADNVRCIKQANGDIKIVFLPIFPDTPRHKQPYKVGQPTPLLNRYSRDWNWRVAPERYNNPSLRGHQSQLVYSFACMVSETTTDDFLNTRPNLKKLLNSARSKEPQRRPPLALVIAAFKFELASMDYEKLEELRQKKLSLTEPRQLGFRIPPTKNKNKLPSAPQSKRQPATLQIKQADLPTKIQNLQTTIDFLQTEILKLSTDVNPAARKIFCHLLNIMSSANNLHRASLHKLLVDCLKLKPNQQTFFLEALDVLCQDDRYRHSYGFAGALDKFADELFVSARANHDYKQFDQVLAKYARFITPDTYRKLLELNAKQHNRPIRKIQSEKPVDVTLSRASNNQKPDGLRFKSIPEQKGTPAETFTVQKIIGEGLSGTVHLFSNESKDGAQPSTKKTFAVKQMHPDKKRNPLPREKRFWNLANPHRPASHPVTAAGDAVETVLIMPNIKGLDLGTHLQNYEQSGVLADETILNNLMAMITEMQRIHARGVVHGDAHSGNIMIQPDGTALFVDFAKSYEVGQPATRFNTTADQPMPHAAPERDEGEAGDPNQDIYSLGDLIKFRYHMKDDNIVKTPNKRLQQKKILNAMADAALDRNHPEKRPTLTQIAAAISLELAIVKSAQDHRLEAVAHIKKALVTGDLNQNKLLRNAVIAHSLTFVLDPTAKVIFNELLQKDIVGIHAGKIRPLLAECLEVTDPPRQLFLLRVLKATLTDSKYYANLNALNQFLVGLSSQIKAGSGWHAINIFIANHEKILARDTFVALSLLNAMYNNPANNGAILLSELRQKLINYDANKGVFRSNTQTVDDLRTLLRQADNLGIPNIPQAAIAALLQSSDNRDSFLRRGAHSANRHRFFQDSCQPGVSPPLVGGKLSATEILISDIGCSFALR